MKNFFILICIVFSVQASFGQQITVKGTVTDQSGALVGVTVVIDGTQNGTVTGIDGGYSIDVPSTQSVLKFSFIG